MRSSTLIPVMCLLGFTTMGVSAANETKPPTGANDGFVWEFAIPGDGPFERLPMRAGSYFASRHSDYRLADTRYPAWASDGNLYSPFTDGKVDGVPSGSGKGANAETGHAVRIGEDRPIRANAVSASSGGGPAVRLGDSRSSMLFPLGLWAVAGTAPLGGQAPAPSIAPPEPKPQLMGNRFLTFNTVVRVRQIEVTRDTAHGPDESSVHTPTEARLFREAIALAWPGARITWAFSWLALHDERESYRELRGLVVSYHKQFGDEITFIPGAYFANMYNTREQVNRDLHEGLQRVSAIVGDGYRPKSVVAGFLAAANLRYLAEEEGIHVCQGNIWSQYAVDNGDGEGSICYPYYPSREHFCKPARGEEDFIDCVNLDGWSVDFLCARIPGARTVHGERWRSRQGVGPIETLLDMGTGRGLQAMLATTATHFDDGFARNGFAWVTCGWEMCLVEARKIYGYGGRNGMEGLHLWLTEVRKRWPDAQLITQGEFGALWRAHFKNNEKLNYQFLHRGSGIRASEADQEIRWFMNRDFRLALLRNWKENGTPKVIDFTRYDLPAKEPADPEPGNHARNWSLINRINQKGIRPQDQPVALTELTGQEQALIRLHYPELFASDPKPE